MKRKPLQHVIQVPSAENTKRAGVIVLDLDNEEEALKVTRSLALSTGRQINLLDEKSALIEILAAVAIH